jgi:hypothetical protein
MSARSSGRYKGRNQTHQILPVARIVHRRSQITGRQKAVDLSDKLAVQWFGIRNPLSDTLLNRGEGHAAVSGFPIDERTFDGNIPLCQPGDIPNIMFPARESFREMKNLPIMDSVG